MARGSRSDRTPSLAMILLLNEIFRMATSYGIPTVTAIFTAAQIGLFLGYIRVPWDNVWDVCISVDEAYHRGDWRRLIFSAFEHGDDWHLYYNMISFLYKGRDLEKRFGSVKFFVILVLFTILTSFSYIGVSMALYEVTSNRNYLHSCAVGFSGVIFALKVLMTHYSPHGRQYVMGIPVAAKYAFWFELVVIQFVSPNASFVGHLAGILVGLAYTMGPLKFVVDTLVTIISGVSMPESSQNRFQSSGSSGYRNSGHDNPYDDPSSRPRAPPYPPMYPDLGGFSRRRGPQYSF
ncbi:Rhomboid-related protein 4 [Halotydeus destructor]|nr:Rhomboid-related protein 4 [Halotydeus destructor]